MSSEQKVVVITDASQGIGESLMKGFRETGYGVVVNARSIKKIGSNDPAGAAVEGGCRLHLRPHRLLTVRAMAHPTKAGSAFAEYLTWPQRRPPVPTLPAPMKPTRMMFLLSVLGAFSSYKAARSREVCDLFESKPGAAREQLGGIAVADVDEEVSANPSADEKFCVDFRWVEARHRPHVETNRSQRQD